MGGGGVMRGEGKTSGGGGRGEDEGVRSKEM